jgi:glucose-6-phosphate 1-dehydrogenase
MEKPPTFDAEAILDAKAELLADIRPIDPRDAVRGQYAGGIVAGEPVRAYREEDRVARDSRTETYAAITAHVDNDRWNGVPFYLRTGKCMSAHVTTIALTLRPSHPRIGADSVEADLLLLGIDPERGLVQRFSAKRPGVDMRIGRASMGFRYETTFDEPPNVGYETLLYHALCGEASLFQRSDMIELEWAAVAPVLEAWGTSDEAPELYAAGQDGPASADALLARDHHRWLPVAPLGTLGLESGATPDS